MIDFPKAEAARFTLYGAAVSPFVRKIRVVMAEKQIPYELVHVSTFEPPEWFAAISPLGRIPVLHDAEAPGDGLLRDSSVIAAYLDRAFPAPPLYPASAWDCAQAMWLEEYADSDLIARVGGQVFRPRLIGMLTGKPCDETLVTKALTKNLPPFFAYLDSRIAGRDYFVGDSLSIADIAVASPFVNFNHVGEAVDDAKYPALAAFLARMHGRESFKPAIAHEKAQLARMGKSK
jgi:glutathione S-transferase